MKRNVLVILTCALIALCVISCDNHTHSYSDKWSSDATNHWHECECGAKKDVTAHTFGNWTVDGTSEKSTCSVCKYEAIRAISKWDGTSADISWYEADKTKKEYTLTSAAQLAGLAKLVNGGTDETKLSDDDKVSFEGVTIKLACNINLGDYQWTPIGLYCDKNDTDGFKKKPFSGTFDGQNHEITGLKIVYDKAASSYRAFFGYIDGTVKNFTVRGEVSACDSSGVVAALENGGKIENVTSYVNVTVKASYEEKGEGDKTFIKAKAAGFVVATKNQSSATNPSYTISNCKNYGNITVEADNARDCLGGILAYSKFKNLTIENCENHGTISTKSSGQRVGGIIGLIQVTTSSTTVKGCKNTGTVQGTANAEKVGDIIGAVEDGATGTMSGCSTRESQKAIGKNDSNSFTVSDAE